MRQIVIRDPQGYVVHMDDNRRRARRHMAKTFDCKWNDLWTRGYRVQDSKAPKINGWSLVEKWA